MCQGKRSGEDDIDSIEDDPEVKLQPDLVDLDGDERELCESNYEVNKVRIKARIL